MLGERRGAHVIANPLSIDHTPYRKDERERLAKAGGVVLSERMAFLAADDRGSSSRLSGGERFSRNMTRKQSASFDAFIEAAGDGGGRSWEKAEQRQRQTTMSPGSQRRGSLNGSPMRLDAEDEEMVDPPKVYERGRTVPGLKHTRSLGEDIWQRRIGITAHAEVTQKELSEQDQFIILASDGVWEYLSSQAVCDRVALFDEPLAACKAVLSEAYSLWLQFEVVTDDITMILAYIDHDAYGKAPRKASDEELRKFESVSMAMTSDAVKAGTADNGRRKTAMPVGFKGLVGSSRPSSSEDDDD